MRKVGRKKKSRIIKTRLFTMLFALLFVVSLFTSFKAAAETKPFSLSSATISDKSSGVTGSISSFTDEEVINDITFHKLNDYATFKLVIKSNLSREITILEITDDNSNSYIDYEYDKHENEKITAGSNLNFEVKAVYKNAVTDTSKRNQTNNVKFTIKYLDNNEQKEADITVNPKTGDNIHISYILLVISSIGLATSIALDKRRRNRKLSKLAVLILTGLVLSPVVVKAATFAYEITFKSTIGLYDKVVVTIDDKVNPVTTQTIDYNTKIDSLPSPTKEGYTLTKWTVGTSDFDINENITSDITIEANYRKNNYTIRFAPNVPVGGTLDPTTSMADMNMEYGEEKNLLPNGYLVTGYLFDSWNTSSDGTGTKYEDMDAVKNLTTTDGEIVTLYARWGATPYTVIFDKNSSQATGTMNNISKEYNETFNLPANTYTRNGYNFNGWNTASNGTGIHYDDEQSVKNLDIDGEITLYAEWSPTLITITFNINTDDPEASGTMAGQIVVFDVQNQLNENEYTRTGYAFDSWNTEPDGSGIKYDDKADITNVFLDNTTLYAQWAVTPYTVIFNKNGGTGSMDNQEIAYGQQVALTKNTYTREHYKFLGWNTQEDKQGSHFDDEELVKNLDIDGEVNLYAEWIELTSTLQTGGNVNAIIKNINADATEFKHYTGTPDFDNINGEEIISSDEANFPTYAWNDNGTIYWWSEAEKVYINESGDSMFRNLTSIESIDLLGLDFSNNITLNRMFAFDSSLTEIKNSNLMNTPNVTSLSHMFYDCSGMEELDLSGWDTSNVNNVDNIFVGMTNLKVLKLNGWNLTNFSNNLTLPTSLTSISMRDAIAGEDMSNFFANLENLKNIDLTNFDTSNTTKMNGMFNKCSSLESLNISSFNTENVTTMSGMFGYCSSLNTLDVSNFNTKKVSNMYGMFAHMDSLQNLNVSGFNTEKVETMNRMFSFSYALSDLDISSFNTSNVTDMESMFHYSKVKHIYVSENFVTNNVTSYNYIFGVMSTELKGGKGTQWSSSLQSNKDYACIDDPDNGKPGLFTDIADKPQP
jgi:uncharacterized repeat protein (TIGR02543 family)